jgi:SAM-dependent methyltransferase
MEDFGNDSISVRCSVCGSTSDSTFLSFRGFRIARCRSCDFIFVNPRPTEEALIRLYSDQQTNPFLKEHFEPFEYELPVLLKVLRRIRQYVPAGKLLEVGCGRGDFLGVAQLQGFSATGCDIFGGRKPVADGITFYDGTLKDAKFPDRFFDVVVIRNILEHLFDPTVEINEIKRVLKPNGYLYLKVPNVDFEYGLCCRLMYHRQYHFDPPYHLNYFSPTSLQRLLEKAQFEFLTWCIEQPTRRSKWSKHLIRQTVHKVIQTSYFLSGGKLFPKPLLACLAKNMSETTRSAYPQ